MKHKQLARIILPLAALSSLMPGMSSGMALILGLVLALGFGNPYSHRTKNLTHKFLALSVMGLGAGMNLNIIGKVGVQGIGYTVVGILVALTLGTILGKFLKTEKDTSILITVGTAICGGSAIAAVAPVIKAKHQEVTVALGTVFLLNALALFIFPWIGHQLNLDQHQFGLWSALAIHDTSSVVGATLQYGTQSLEVGTTVKLARALWIIPVAMLIGLTRYKAEVSQNENKINRTKAKRPWFILGFVVIAAIMTWFPEIAPYGHLIELAAKKLMVLTLFLMGASLTKDTVKSVGLMPFIQGVLLWVVMASGSLAAIYEGFIH